MSLFPLLDRLTWLTGLGLSVIQDSELEARGTIIAIRNPQRFLIMADVLFAHEWWTVPEEDYQEAYMALKTLAAKDLDPGTKDVSILVGHLCAERGLISRVKFF